MMLSCPNCGLSIETSTPPLRCVCGNVVGSDNSIPAAITREKVGRELEKIVPKFFKGKNCGCRGYARKMDRWGIDGCQSRFDEIVDHLEEQANKNAVVKHLGPVNRFVAARWLTQAIDNAKEQVSNPPKYSAVWVYWAAGAIGEELRYSIRSAESNIDDLKNISICGDIPSWFTGHAIPSPKWTKRQNAEQFGTKRWAKVIDSIVKLKRIIDDPNVTDDFLWMYDDTFIVKPMEIADLLEPLASGHIRESERNRGKWRRVRERTAKALNDANLPTWNYSTHCPIVYNKQRLRETIETFRPDIRPRVIESLYCNHWHDNPRSTSGFFHYSQRPPKGWAPPKWSSVVNVGKFNDAASKAIMPMFSEACSVEVGAVTTS